MAKSKSKSGVRPKKRKHCFYRNKQTSNDSMCSDEGISRSAKKIKLESINNSAESKEEVFNGYRLFDLDLLCATIENFLCCKGCGNDVKITEELQHGLSSKFCICCEICEKQTSFRNSRMLGPRSNIPEVNRRSIYAMRTVGLGLTSLKTFCGVMDLPAPISSTTSRPILTTIKNAVATTAEKSMNQAVLDEKVLTTLDDGICVSGDGTWKTRGHSSHIGVCSVIGAESGKVIDVEILSSSCRGCQNYKGAKVGQRYNSWLKTHSTKCTKNHSGSTAKMEVNGMTKIFTRSERHRDTRYLQYIGDGDTKTYPEIKKLQPYGCDVNIEKIECVNHIKKRMGARLRKMKQDRKGQKLLDKKTLSGKGRLTDKIVNRFSAYYGNAIRNHKDSLSDMRKAVWAVFYHSRSTDDEPTHHFCPKGPSSFCKFQQAVANNTHQSFKHTNSVPAAVMDAIKPVFRDLSNPALLKRCLKNRTQNANESFNSVVWKYCPKSSGSGLLIAETAAYEAVIAYNDGNQGRLLTMKELGLLPGVNARRAAKAADKERLIGAERQAAISTKEARKVKRQLLTKTSKDNFQHEGVVYAAGLF